MQLTFVFYKTDASFDYGDFPGGTCYVEDEHGLTIELNDNDEMIIESVEGFGNFHYLTKKYTKETLKKEVLSHIKDIQKGGNEKVTSIDFDSLDIFLDEIDK